MIYYYHSSLLIISFTTTNRAITRGYLIIGFITSWTTLMLSFHCFTMNNIMDAMITCLVPCPGVKPLEWGHLLTYELGTQMWPKCICGWGSNPTEELRALPQNSAHGEETGCPQEPLPHSWLGSLASNYGLLGLKSGRPLKFHKNALVGVSYLLGSFCIVRWMGSWYTWSGCVWGSIIYCTR